VRRGGFRGATRRRLFEVVGDAETLARRVVHQAGGLLRGLQVGDPLLDLLQFFWIEFSRSMISCLVTRRLSRRSAADR